MHVVSKTVKPLLDDLLGFPCTQIGFLTLDITLHFHNFKDNLNVESAPGPALKAAFMVMGQIGEGLLVFQSTLPSLGIVCLKLQGDDIRAYGTDKKHIPREPEGPFYKQMSSEFTKNQIAVDIFSFEFSGEIYWWSGVPSLSMNPSFQETTHGNLNMRLAETLLGKLLGVCFTTYHGHFVLSWKIDVKNANLAKCQRSIFLKEPDRTDGSLKQDAPELMNGILGGSLANFPVLSKVQLREFHGSTKSPREITSTLDSGGELECISQWKTLWSDHTHSWRKQLLKGVKKLMISPALLVCRHAPQLMPRRWCWEPVRPNTVYLCCWRWSEHPSNWECAASGLG